MSDSIIRLEILFNGTNTSVVRTINSSLTETSTRLASLRVNALASTAAMRAFNAELNRSAMGFQNSFGNAIRTVSDGFRRLQELIHKFATFSFATTVGGIFSVGFALRDLGKQFLFINEQFATMQITMKSSFNSVAVARGMREELAKITASTPIPFKNLADLMRAASVIPYTRGELLKQSTSGQSYDDPNGMMRRLIALDEKMTTFRPDKSERDVIFSLREALSGNFRSLIRRFDVPSASIAAATGKSFSQLKADPGATLTALETFFGNIITPQAVQESIRQPQKLWQNLIEQILDVPLLRIGDAGFYNKFLDVFVNVYESATRFMESGGFEPYAKRISDALTGALGATISASGGLFDRLLHATGGQGANDRPGVSLAERSFAAFTAVTEKFAHTLPAAIDTTIKLFNALLPVVEGFSQIMFKAATAFGNAYAAHPELTLGVGIAATTIGPAVMRAIGESLSTKMAEGVTKGMVNAMTGRALRSGTGSTNAISAMLASGSTSAELQSPSIFALLGSMIPGTAANRAKNDPFNKGNLAKYLVRDAQGDHYLPYDVANQAGLVGAGWKRNQPVPVSASMAKRLTTSGGLMAGEQGLVGGLLGGGAALVEIFAPLIAAIVAFASAVAVFKWASSKFSEWSDRQFSGVTLGVSRSSVATVGGQLNQDFSALAEARKQQNYLMQGKGQTPLPDEDTNKYSFPIIFGAMVRKAGLSGSSVSQAIGGSPMLGSSSSTSIIPRLGTADLTPAQIKQDTENLLKFHNDIQDLIDRKVSSLPAGSYTSVNGRWSSPSFNSGNIGDLKGTLLPMIDSLVAQRSAAEPELIKKMSARLDAEHQVVSKPFIGGDGETLLAKLVTESSQYLIPKNLVGNNPQLGNLGFDKFSSAALAAQQNNVAAENALTTISEGIDKGNPAHGTLQLLKQLDDSAGSISAFKDIIESVMAAAKSSEGQKSLSDLSAHISAKVLSDKGDLQKQYADNPTELKSAVDRYMKDAGTNMLKMAQDLKDGTWTLAQIAEANANLKAANTDVFLNKTVGFMGMVDDVLKGTYGDSTSSMTANLSGLKSALTNYSTSLGLSATGAAAWVSSMSNLMLGTVPDKSLTGIAAVGNSQSVMANRLKLAKSPNALLSAKMFDSWDTSSSLYGNLTGANRNVLDSIQGEMSQGNQLSSAEQSAQDTLNIEATQRIKAYSLQQAIASLGRFSDIKNFSSSDGTGLGAAVSASTVQQMKEGFKELGVVIPVDQMGKFKGLLKDSSDPEDIGAMIKKYQDWIPLLTDAANQLQRQIDTASTPALKEAYTQRNTPIIENMLGSANTMQGSINNIQGDGYFSSMKEGFTGVTEKWREEAANMSSIGSSLANNLSSGFGEAFTKFAENTKQGGAAFRQFALSIMQSTAQMLATKAFQSILGMAVGGFMNMGGSIASAGVGAATTTAANVGMSTGMSMVPGFARGGEITVGSGSVDDVPALLMKGEGVLNRQAMASIGSAGLMALNSGRSLPRYAAGGSVGVVTGPAAAGNTFHINTTVNAGTGDTSTTTGGKSNSAESEARSREMARAIESAVHAVVTNMRRPGGQLRAA